MSWFSRLFKKQGNKDPWEGLPYADYFVEGYGDVTMSGVINARSYDEARDLFRERNQQFKFDWYRIYPKGYYHNPDMKQIRYN